MTLKIQVYSDYVCPFCFLGKVPLEQAVEGKDVELEWMPFELRPEPAPPIDPINDAPKRASWDSYIKPAAAKLGLEMRLPNLSPHPYTGLAFEGFQFAKEQGKGTAYNDRVFRAFFQEEQNIGDIGVLTRLAAEIGLDSAAFKQALEERRYREAQQQSLQHAYHEAGIQAVPTIKIGSQVIQGMASKETIERIIQQELQQAQVQPGDSGLACGIDDNNC